MKSSQRDKVVMSVFEHQRLTEQDFTYASDFSWLLAQELSVFTIKRQRGQWQLKVGHYIGIIILPSNITLEILPKPINKAGQSASDKQQEIAQTRLWLQQLLDDLITHNHAGDSQNNRNQSHNKPFNKFPAIKHFGQIAGNTNPLPIHTSPLSQWLIERFLALLTSYQPNKHYQTTVQNQATLQGKLLIKQQLRVNSHQPHRFVSEVSHLSPQMLSNQLIKTALQLVEPLFQLTTAPKAFFHWQCITFLSQIELRRIDALYLKAKQQLDLQPLPRVQKAAAQQLLALAYWLLKTQQASLPTGIGLTDSVKTAHSKDNRPPTLANTCQLRLCLLINMNQAFEQWASLRIAAMLMQQDNHYQAFYQSQHIWLKDSAGQTILSMRPDLVMCHGMENYKADTDKTSSHSTLSNNFTSDTSDKLTNQPSKPVVSHVIDIKWKPLSQPSDISASDAYQLTSYAQAYQTKQVWLVYPVTDSTRQPIALRQLTLNDAAADQNTATLWLMPFNVLTGSLTIEAG